VLKSVGLVVAEGANNKYNIKTMAKEHSKIYK